MFLDNFTAYPASSNIMNWYHARSSSKMNTHAQVEAKAGSVAVYGLAGYSCQHSTFNRITGNYPASTLYGLGYNIMDTDKMTVRSILRLCACLQRWRRSSVGLMSPPLRSWQDNASSPKLYHNTTHRGSSYVSKDSHLDYE